MKRVAVAAATALFGLACGADAPEPAAPSAPSGQFGAEAPAGQNQPPVVESAMLAPANASAEDALAVEVHAEDPDHDRVSMTYEWYSDGELVGELRENYVPAGRFARGERVHAVVYVADREHQVSLQTAELTIHNAPPRIDSVTISPARPTSQDLIEAQASGHDADSDEFAYEYRWFKNGQPLASASGPRLEPGTLKRGDQLSVQAVGRDSNDVGPPVASSPVTVQNSSPTITSQPNYDLGPSGKYSYEVAAKDPDGDEPLRYELLAAPPGMTVDVTSGRVTWNVPADAKGTYQIELAVSDGYGGRTLQNYALALDWNDAPANASESAGKAPEESDGSATGSAAKKPAAKQATPAAKQPAKAKPSDDDDTEVDQDLDQEQDQEQSEEADEEQF